GWTLDAAECICSDGNIKPEVILVLLNHLINKSLVMMVENNGKTRYHMLEIIRQYAYEKLLESGEELYTRDHHLKYFLKLSELIEPELVRAQQIEWIARTNIESSNIRAALQHAIQTDIEAGLYITGRLGHFWTDFDSHEATRWLTDFLQSSESTRYPQARAVALSTMSRFLFNFEQYDEAHATAEEALALFRIEGNQYGEVDMLVFLAGIFMMGPIADPTIGAEIARQALSLAQSLGDFKRQADALNILAWDHRDFKRAFSSWEEAVKLYRQVGHWTRLARSLSQFGFFLLMDGQLDAAQRCMDEANSLFQQLNIKGRSSLLAGLGQIALIRGNYEQARAYFQEDARISNEIGNRLDNLWAKCRLGYAELLLGDSISAQHNFAESAQSFQKDGNRIGVVFTLEGMSSLYLTIGKADVAAQLIGWADTTRQKIKDTRPKLEQVGVDKVISACISKMGDKTFLEAYNKGKYMSLDEAVDLALKIANERE
ncbi:MAG TPA: hypothetical protein VFY66_11105, partial [Anaerolineales bacterium]|nr:hypothetical protein [Anaerolineales bacterium]